MNRWHDIFGQTPPSFRDRVHTTLLELEDNAMTQNNHNHKPRHGRKTARTVLLVAAAAALLMGTAYAVTSHSDFFQGVFGTGVEGQEATTVELTDEDGNVAKTEDIPAYERVEVDEELAEELVGAQIATAGTSVTLQGYEFTVCEYVFDENGIGAVTVDIKSPTGAEGLQYSETAKCMPFSFNFNDENGRMLDCMEYEDQSASTGDTFRYVCYVTPFDTSSAGTDIVVTLSAFTGEYEELEAGPEEEFDTVMDPIFEEMELVIPASEAVSAVTFTGDTITASVSPVGMMLTFPETDASEYTGDELVIHYTDGSEYVLKGEDVENIAVSSMQTSYDEAFGYVGHQTDWYAFNRLVDVDSIESITFVGYHCPADPDGDIEDISETLLPAA